MIDALSDTFKVNCRNEDKQTDVSGGEPKEYDGCRIQKGILNRGS